MRYSKGAATLLSTVFSFGVKSGVVADIFDSSNELLIGTATAANGLTATSTVTQQNSVAVDAGILENPAATSAGGTDVINSSSEITIASSCDKIITCKNGKDISDVTGDTTCFKTCAGDCCTFDDNGTPEDACIGFTGKVCKDGDSCNGKQACEKAQIPSVVNSCVGYKACCDAGFIGGSIGNIDGSCGREFSCYRLGTVNGKVGNVLNSCNYIGACSYAAFEGGIIGSITNSCNEGINACDGLGSEYGTVGNVLKSCNGFFACFGGASSGGSIGNIITSCKGDQACDGLGEAGGTVGNINNYSCTADFSCRDLGLGRGKVGHVTNSCTEKESCQYAGSKRGSIGSISQSCKAADACHSAGSGSSGRITSNLLNCCNAPIGGECKDDTQATLPATCKAPTPKPPPASKSAKRARHMTVHQVNEFVE